MLTLDNYLLSCGSSGGRVSGGVGGGRVVSGGDSGSDSDCGGDGGGGSGGSDGSGNGNGCGWLWLLFIVVNILFYCSKYIILLWCLYYFIVSKAKIDPLLQHVL